MPVYEFNCDACGAEFEELVAPGATAPCPACGNERVARRFSAIAERGTGVGLTGAAARDSNSRRAEREAAKKDGFVAERKRRRGQGPPGG